MANEVTATTLTHQIMTEAIRAEIGEQVLENSILLPLCDIQDISGSPTLTASWQQHAAMTVSTITDGTAMTNAAYSLANQTATASGYGVMFTMTDLGLKSTVGNSELEIPASALRDVVSKMDQVVGAALGTFTGASQNVGSTGVAISLANMLSAVTNLKINAKGFADRSPVFVFHPQMVYDIQAEATGAYNTTSLTTTQAVAMSPVFSRDDYVGLLGTGRVLSMIAGTFMGIPVLSSNNVALANSGADRAGALLIPGEALACALKFAPSVEMQRSVSNGIKGWTGIADCAFAVTEKRDVCGVTCLGDA